MVSIIRAWERSFLAIRTLVLLGRHFFLFSLSIIRDLREPPNFSTLYTTTTVYCLLCYTTSRHSSTFPSTTQPPHHTINMPSVGNSFPPCPGPPPKGPLPPLPK